MTEIQIAKYECMENDFCIVTHDAQTFTWTPRRVAEVCHRRRGLGSDGLIILKSLQSSSVEFRLFNADGSGAEWSGNGARCAAAFIHQRTRKTAFSIKTKAGTIPVACKPSKGRNTTVSLDSPVPLLQTLGRVATIRLRRARGPFAVDAGNPHWVYVVPDFKYDWEAVGARCQEANPKTHGVNVEFVRIVNRKRVDMRLYERGVGPTPSSGTGALAGTMVCRHLEEIEPRIQVVSPGGMQAVDYAIAPDKVRLTAIANFVFSGTIVLS